MSNHKRRLLLTAVLCLVLLFSLTAGMSTGGKNGAVLFQTRLTGAAEAPGPGDPDGSGGALIKISPKLGLVCWMIEVKDIKLPATAAHIHIGAAGVPGPVVVGLNAPGETGKTQGCRAVAADTIKAILANPSGYYVNVHNTDYPAGALRGQLP